MKRLVVLAPLLIGCPGGDDGDDACPAPPVVTFDNGTCGDQLRFTGEYVDFDDDTVFCGIFNALFEVPGGATDTTAPNGRFDMCLGTVEVASITPAPDLSQCTQPRSTYPMHGIAVANGEALRAGMFWSGRNITVDRMATLGVTLDPAKAHVFVHVDQGSRTIAIDAAHDAPMAIADADWAAGDTGHEVFFPNVEIGGGATTVTATGGCVVGAGSVPLVANTITNSSILAYQ